MTPDAGWLAFREPDEVLGASRMAARKLAKDRTGRHPTSSSGPFDREYFYSMNHMENAG
jgi:hypothetical protein